MILQWILLAREYRSPPFRLRKKNLGDGWRYIFDTYRRSKQQVYLALIKRAERSVVRAHGDKIARISPRKERAHGSRFEPSLAVLVGEPTPGGSRS